MRSLFSRDSPNRPRNNNGSSRESAGELAKRKTFAFMKYGGEDRRTSESIQATREHARRLAMMQNEEEPVFQPEFPASSSAAFDFNPFGQESVKSNNAAPAAVASSYNNNSTSAYNGASATKRRANSNRRPKPAAATPPPLPPQEDFFAQAPKEDLFAQDPKEDFFVQAAANSSIPPPPPEQPQTTSSSYQRKASYGSFGSSAPAFDSFENETFSSGAFDVDPFSSSQQNEQQYPSMPPKQQQLTPAQRRMNKKGRPPRSDNAKSAPSSEVSFGSVTSSQWPSTHSQPNLFQQNLSTPPRSSRHVPQQYQQEPPKRTMATFPSNSSMQSSFTGPSRPSSGSSAPKVVSYTPSSAMTPPPTSSGSVGGGAAARRRMRSQMRHSSSGSLGGSESASFDESSSPPASPMSGRPLHPAHSNGSVGSSNGNTQQQQHARNRVSSYTFSGQQHTSNNTPGGGGWQHSPSPSVRGSGASVCSSAAESDVDLFDSRNTGGGFTFDAFGLDASEIDREVQEAMQAITGPGEFNPFGFSASHSTNNSTSSTGQDNNTQLNKQQFDNSGDEFEPQVWDSPPGSRRSTPAPPQDVEEYDGFVDGFRVSKPSPLPQISVHRSPANSERSSSLSSITDHNTEHGAPRRNVFKEKAGFSSSNRSRTRRSTQPQSKAPTRKQWVPPPGAVKMLTPPRREIAKGQEAAPQRQQEPPCPSLSVDEEAERFWNDHLVQIDDAVKVENNERQALAKQQQSTLVPATSKEDVASTLKNRWQSVAKEGTHSLKNKWQTPAAKYSNSASQPQQREQQSEMPQPAARFTQEASFRKQKGEEKKEDDASAEDRDNQTDTTSAMTTVFSEPQSSLSPGMNHTKPTIRTDLHQSEETESAALTPTELRRLELDRLRHSTASGKPFKANLLHSVTTGENKMIKPQQQRANECNDLRSSFASLKERLKSPVEKKEANNSNTVQQQQQGVFFASPDAPHAPKSEVGVSSFARQKMKIASLSSSSKSEVGVSRSPRNREQSELTDSVVNRMRERNVDSAPSAATRASLTVSSSTPAFMAIKLRKIETSPSLKHNGSDQTDDASLSDGLEFKDSYSEHREQEPSQTQEINESSSGDYHRNSYNGQPPVQSPKRQSYRERQMAKEREVKVEHPATQSYEEPKRNVEDMIRRRIAANKANRASSPANENLQTDTFDAPGDEHFTNIDKARVSLQPPILPPKESESHPREKLATAVGGISAGGLSSLHAQLKQRQDLQEQDTQTHSATKGDQAKLHGRPRLEKLELTAADSQGSDKKGSPTRTPKATYAMLNAFLHGRETVSGPEESPFKSKFGEENDDSATSPPNSSTQASSVHIDDGRPALKNDPKYSRYFTMLKIGMPMDVVKHALVRDNLDPKIMDGDHNKPAPIGGVPLKEDPKYSKYFKMLKIGMPMEAVKHAMERDGLNSHVMDQDHNLPADSNMDNKDEGPKEKDSHRRSRLHWKPIREVRRNSLWAKIDEEIDPDNIEIDEEEFAELFQAEIETDVDQAKKTKARSPRKGAAVRVIDPKRANNGGIILARLKLDHDEMADVVDRIDENGMTGEQIEHIIEYLPTADERRALEAYMLEGGQDASEKFDGLCECEKFMVSMMTVEHAKRKVRALLFKLQFEEALEALYQETYTVEASCDELSNSVRLRQLLGIILTFGNRLNTAGKGKKKKAGAFTLDSLLKLNQAKAFDKKTTFLNYIVQIVQRNNELLLRFADDLPTVAKADKVFWEQCVSDLEEVENQLENVRRIALYQARQAKKFRRQKKRHPNGEDGDEESLSDMSLSLEEEVEALRSSPIGLFTLSAIKKVSFLRDRVEGTKVKFQKLLEYFGEDKNSTQPHELFSTIVKFCRDFEKAKEQVFAQETKKKREERKRQSITNGRNASKTPGKPPQHSQMPMRASNMQPNASRLIEDMKRNSQAFAKRQTPPGIPSQAPQQHQQRRDFTPSVSPPHSEVSPRSCHPISETTLGPTGNSNASSVQSTRQHTAGAGQTFACDSQEMKEKAASLTNMHRQDSSQNANEYPSSPSQVKAEPTARGSGALSNFASASHQQTREVDSSVSSSETGSAALRRKVRMRSRRPGSTSSPESRPEDPTIAASNTSRHQSGLATACGAECPSSVPTKDSANDLLRSKLRHKRMLEMKRREAIEQEQSS